MTLAQRLIVQSLIIVVFLAAVATAIVQGWLEREAMVGAAIIAGALALIGTIVFARSVSRPVIELREVARALAGGDLTRRPALAAPGEVGELATALHRLAEQLEMRLSALQAERALLGAIFESLNEGILVVDGHERVVRVNEAGRQLLRLGDATAPFSTDLLPRDRPLHQALHAALRGEAPEAEEIALGDRRVSVVTRPLRGGGAVAALFDLTQIRRLEKVRRDFVANVSHELRTPLTVIGGFAETLAADELPPEKRKRFADLILTNAQRMQRIVDDLLDLSRIESGGWVPGPTDLDAALVAAEALDAARAEAEEKALALETRIAPDAQVVRADRTALRQILTNLIENAIRHTDRGGITVFTEADAGGVWVGVTDTGSGIGAEHLPRIFERFYRADSGRSRESGGTGLGLAIVRHLVEAHGGRVRAESDVGRGTTIAAFFPNDSD